MFKRIALGISGGVDSAVAALLLKRAGYHVEGVFMRNWDSNYESGFCSDEKDFEDATFVCRVRLLQPKDKFKDQTFFLSQVKQFSLRRCMFPLANLLKSQVREIAKSEGLLNVATKKDSTGICFIGKKRFQDFIEEYIETKRGNFIDIDTGQIVGEHSGLHKWTVGQRCCLADWKDAYFIFKKDLDTNNIYVVAGTNHPAIRNDICFTRKPHWIYNEPQELSRGDMLYCSFRFQHTKPLVPCRIVNNSEGLTIYLDRKLRAITEGQYGVLYKDGECLGSAKIADVCRDLIY
ncbi:mitochondrial tRNA-specific 2-thiouridylase 1 isoform X2 [Plodia interpunctella]|uniref:mitochondrial tRNA-specific 2-thiouridylase 1 isoform X2 n=1 Tax=Plodia interpunctella TaxID=58824 RepID=UPI00236857AD|nr:mitochondrial tRNA-specific 2-thiouridylase 1 isoform X2 [Plodia interpunctella]